MTQPDTPALAGMSIGAVLDLLRPDFPDVTISKIRFLEAEGLVTPQRPASGYRRFTAYDCARLRFILTAQRDQYLPLKVIKAQLDAQPDGELPARRIALRRTAAGVRCRHRCRASCPDVCGRTHPGPAEPGGPARAVGRRRRPADRADQGRRDHDRAGRFLRRARGGDRRSAPAPWRNTASSRGTCGRSARRPTGSPI